MFFFSEGGGYMLELANFEEANPLSTPEHIAPVWYYSPYYAMLRAVPDKLGGLVVMGAAIAILFVVPWLDGSKAASIRYKGILSKIAMTIFIIKLAYASMAWHSSGYSLKNNVKYHWHGNLFCIFLLMPIYTSN